MLIQLLLLLLVLLMTTSKSEAKPVVAETLGTGIILGSIGLGSIILGGILGLNTAVSVSNSNYFNIIHNKNFELFVSSQMQVRKGALASGIGHHYYGLLLI